MTTLIMLRHPTPLGGAGLCYGRLDLPCAPEAAEEIAVACASAPKACSILSSPASRALSLARALAARDGLAVEVDARLQELDFGAWEGRRWSEIDRRESDPWATDPMNRAPPGGESFAALRARVSDALDELAERTLIVTHAGPIRAARMRAEGISFEAAFAEPVAHAVPIRLDWSACVGG
ncbi:MAG: histidine phosphatase family protein [Pseudomonadota bacterium]